MKPHQAYLCSVLLEQLSLDAGVAEFLAETSDDLSYITIEQLNAYKIDPEDSDVMLIPSIRKICAKMNQDKVHWLILDNDY